MQWILRYCTPVKTVLIRDKSIIRFIFDQTVAGITETRPGSVWIAMKVSPRGVDGYTLGSYNKQIIDILDSNYKSQYEVLKKGFIELKTKFGGSDNV